MRTYTHSLLILVIAVMSLGALTSYAFAQQATSTEDGTPINEDGVATSEGGTVDSSGVLNCSRGEFGTGVAAFKAAAIHVPVADYAVTQNTATLVYKECVLDVISRQMGQEVSRAIVDATIRYANEGNNGGSFYPANIQESARAAGVARVEQLFNGSTLVNAPYYAGEVSESVLRNYYEELNQPGKKFECEFPGEAGDHEAFSKGDFTRGSWLGLWVSATKPACTKFGFLGKLEVETYAQEGAGEAEYLFELEINDGLESKKDAEGNVVTPGGQIKTLVDDALVTSQRQAENMDEVGEMIEPMFAELSARVLGHPGGLRGLSQADGTGGSYLDRLRDAVRGVLRGTLVNTAVRIIGEAIAREDEYRAHRESSFTSVQNAIGALRDIEAQCWEQKGTPESERTTEHSDTAIEENGLEELAVFLEAEINSSIEAREALVALAQTVESASSGQAQQAALAQLNELISLGEVHTSAQVQQAAEAAQEAVGEMEILVEGTFDEWTSENGWCATNNTEV